MLAKLLKPIHTFITQYVPEPWHFQASHVTPANEASSGVAAITVNDQGMVLYPKVFQRSQGCLNPMYISPQK